MTALVSDCNRPAAHRQINSMPDLIPPDYTLTDFFNLNDQTEQPMPNRASVDAPNEPHVNAPLTTGCTSANEFTTDREHSNNFATPNNAHIRTHEKTQQLEVTRPAEWPQRSLSLPQQPTPSAPIAPNRPVSPGGLACVKQIMQKRIFNICTKVASSAVRNQNSLMYMTDQTTGFSALVDGGCMSSVVPPTKADREQVNCGFEMKGAGKAPIRTYGTRIVRFLIGSTRVRWRFIVADVETPIIGIDIMRACGLLIDPVNNKVIVSDTGEEVKCTTAPVASNCLQVIITEPDPLIKLVEDRPELTSTSDGSAELKHDHVHYIHTEGPPVKAGIRHYNPTISRIIKDTFEEYWRLGYVRPSDSPCTSPLAVVPKKDGSFRVCGDFRKLNLQTRGDSYPLPYLASFNNSMEGSKIFSKIDMEKAYHQIPIYPPHIYKTAVATPHGAWEFIRMPFGLKTAAQTFQRFINGILAEFSDFVFCYIDDIIIHSTGLEEHKKHLERVLDRLVKHGLKINIKKSEFGKEKLEFLGFEVNAQGVEPNADKVRAIAEMPIPSKIAHVKRYLGMIGYYARHIPHFATLRSPLNEYMSRPRSENRQPAQLNAEQIQAFHGLNDALCNAALLYHPRHDATLTIHTDSSSIGVGGVLNQINPELNQLEPLFFFSKKLDTAWKDHAIYRKELEAAYLTVKRLAKFLIGQKTILYVDNSALYHALRNPKDQPPMDLRRMLLINQYVDEIRLVKSSDNVVADALSRCEASCNQIRLEARVDYAKLFAAQREDPWTSNLKENEFFKLKEKRIGEQSFQVWVYENDLIQDLICVPDNMVEQVVEAYHVVYHAGYKATTRSLATLFYWPTLKKDVKRFVKYCTDCQQAKRSRRNIVPFSRINVPAVRFQHVHMDIVGPIGQATRPDQPAYIVTMIDRHTRYLVAEAVAKIDTATVWRAFMNSWIKYFGVPGLLTTDRGAQFNNSLFRSWCTNLNVRLNHTTAYHPCSNGIVEREHSKLKASLRAIGDPAWHLRLPIVILAWNNAVREDYQHSPAQMLYGTNVRLPLDFFEDRCEKLTSELAEQYDRELTLFRAQRTCQHAARYPTFTHPGLRSCEFVWITNETAQGLKRPYIGPYRVLSRSDNYFEIIKSTRVVGGQVERLTDRVNISRLEPAFLLANSALVIP